MSSMSETFEQLKEQLNKWIAEEGNPVAQHARVVRARITNPDDYCIMETEVANMRNYLKNNE